MVVDIDKCAHTPDCLTGQCFGHGDAITGAIRGTGHVRFFIWMLARLVSVGVYQERRYIATRVRLVCCGFQRDGPCLTKGNLDAAAVCAEITRMGRCGVLRQRVAVVIQHRIEFGVGGQQRGHTAMEVFG